MSGAATSHLAALHGPAGAAALNTVAELFDGHVYACSPDYTVLYANARLVERTGRDPVGEPCYEVLHGRSEPCPWCKNEEVFAGQTVQWEIKSPKDGRWYGIVNAAVPWLEKGSLAKLALIQDITEKKLWEEESAFFRDVIDRSNDAVLILEPDDARILYVNLKACESLGYRAEELRGMRAVDFEARVPTLEEWRAWVGELRERGQLLYESTHRRRDGSSLPVEVNVNFVRRGEREFLVAIVRDVAERRRAQQRLVGEHNKLESLLAAIEEGVTVQDREFRVLYQNQAHIKTYGARKGELCYRAYRQREEVCDGCAARECFADGQVHRRETTVTTEEGTLHIEVSASPLRNAQGEIVAAIEMVRDVTEQRCLEARFRQSQKMQAIGTLAGGIAHDFNNLLAAIMGRTDLALHKLSTGNSNVRGDLEVVMLASERARDLVQQILTFSRADAADRKPMRISVIVKETLKLLHSTLPSSLALRAEINATEALVQSDPAMLQQVLMNLCVNAVQAMEGAHGVLEVGLNALTAGARQNVGPPELRPGRYVVLSVRDTGCGMPAEVLERIFEPFFTTKGAGEGTGLGLSVVHGIVRSHGGAITAESTPGEGTVFRVYLPIVESAGAASLVPPEKPCAGTERVLFVDDDEAVARTGAGILDGLGYRVSAVTDSERALELVRAEPESFDLVVTDLIMPRFTGEELAREIRKIRPDLPLILCSGGLGQIDRERLAESGIDGFLGKPLTLRQLAQEVRRVLDLAPRLPPPSGRQSSGSPQT